MNLLPPIEGKKNVEALLIDIDDHGSIMISASISSVGRC
jgi:hypothetical protein